MKNVMTLIGIITNVLFIQNCDQQGITSPETGSEVASCSTDECLEEVEAYVNDGNEAFFNFMMNGPDECPEFDEEMNGSVSNMVQECLVMSDIEEKYDKALEKDTNHKGAIFGKAYMELFQITQDELLKTTIDQWESCFKHYTDEGLERSIINSSKFDIWLPKSGNAFFSFDPKRFLNFIPIITSKEDLLIRNNEECPDISSVQDLLEDLFLPRISNTIDKLDQILGNNFVFTIKPEMINDEGGDKIELDDTEIYLMKAAMHQIRALIYAIITYDVNVPYYDLIDDIIDGDGYPTTSMDWTWLSTNSSLLTIRSGQENSWSNAHTDLINVLNSIENAWSFLDKDTYTDYDAIQKDMVECNNEEEDCLTVPDFIDEIRNILNNPYTLELNFDDCIEVYNDNGYYEEECSDNIVNITVDIKGFLTNPPQNLKSILPTYSVSTSTCVWEDCYEEYNDNGYYEDVCEDSGTWGCPVFIWETDTCDDWKNDWDYTIGGLFPNMTQDKFINDIIGEDIDAEDCEEILEGKFEF